MRTIDEQDRKAFEAIGQNMFIEYTDDERVRLARMAVELRNITGTALERLRKAS